MRVLVIADIHGNRAALEAIREPFDLCVCAGDLVDYGPEPGPCIDWVRKNATYCVRGNHDHGVAQNVEVLGVGGFRWLTALTRPLSIAAVTPEQRRYLADLPTACMFVVDGKRFLMVHATPRDPMDEYASPDPAFWKPRLAGIKADYLIVGHTHQAYTLQVNGTLIVNPGSVGLSRNGDPRAAYAIIENGAVELKRIDYPIHETVRACEAQLTDPVARQMLCDVLRTGGLPTRWIKSGGAPSNGSAADDDINAPTERMVE